MIALNIYCSSRWCLFFIFFAN